MIAQRAALPLVEWCYPGGAVMSASRATIGRADELVYELTCKRPAPRVWIDGEVIEPGEGFITRAEPRRAA